MPLDSTIQLGEPVSHRGVVVAPLFPRLTPAAAYVTLDEALPLGFRVTEVDAAGLVPELTVHNPLDRNVLLYDGEELIGAKQNRILNATFLIASNTEVIIPVSCVEQGRWSYRSSKFASGEKVMPPSMRREHQKVVAMSLNEGVGYRSNQGMIWNELAMKSERMAAHSATGLWPTSLRGRKTGLGSTLRPSGW